MKTPKQYQFIIQLGRALHIYGVPSYKIQIYLSQVAKTKGIRGSFMDTPTWINYVFYSENEDESYNHIESVSPGGLNLGALSSAVEITDQVLADQIDFDEASLKLRMVYKQSKKANHLLLSLAFALGAGAFLSFVRYQHCILYYRQRNGNSCIWFNVPLRNLNL